MAADKGSIVYNYDEFEVYKLTIPQGTYNECLEWILLSWFIDTWSQPNRKHDIID